MPSLAQPAVRLASPALLAVAALTVAGFVLRALQFDQSLFADELSTYWIVHDHSLGEVLRSIRSNDEITPPLYFVLGWLSLKIGPDPEWVRLPSLIAGTATIPLLYALGARTVGRRAGVVAAAVAALSPFLVYYSVEARSYALMIALLAASTVALLIALERRRARWWAAYAACSCAAMLSHYTAAFPLAAQVGWALWAHRDAGRELLLANLGALAGFAPWIPGFLADNRSPTTGILSALSPFDLDSARFSVEAWVAGFPYVRLEAVPGRLAGLLIAAAVLVAAAAVLVPRIVAARSGASWRPPEGLVLVVALALAAPLGEAVVSAVGTNVFGARNLNASWPGLAVSLGALVTAAGPLLAPVCASLLLAGYAIAAAKTLDPDLARPDYAGIAAFVETRAESGDVVIDAAGFTPVPLTGLDVYLRAPGPELRPGLPDSDEPFMVGDPVPAPGPLVDRAFAAARGRSVFLVGSVPDDSLDRTTTPQLAYLVEQRRRLAAMALRRRPQGFRVVAERDFAPLAVYELRDSG
jgi:4-amino-4-deoxy-L-arabinose transferase-like glycosyltransferase